jgi:glycosyltransferase involved in cell wall biosynthesis
MDNFKAGDDAEPAVSVIIPSYNSGRTIRYCLDSVVNQETDLKYEVILVDSSTDDTRQIIEAYGTQVRLLASPAQLDPGPARNLGIEHARAEIIAFTDTDCVPDTDWIESIYRAHQRHDAVGGRILNGTPANLVGTALYLVEFSEYAAFKDRQLKNVPTANMSYKKKVFAQYGCFPVIAWGEEYVLNTKIEAGIFLSKKIVVKHMNRTDFAEAIRHSFKGGYGCALSRKEANHVRFLFKYRFLIPLLVFFRCGKIGLKAIQSGNFLKFLLASPIIVIDLTAWTAGFFRGTGE